MKINYIGLIAAIAVGLAGNTFAADKTSGQGQLTNKDYKFVTDAAKGGLMEVHLGEMARQNGVNTAVKNFGTRMVTDHGKANEELKKLASKKGVTLPVDAMEDANEEMKGIHKKTGVEFDKAYTKHMVKDHEKDVEEFEKASKEADDPDVKAFAAKHLPILQEHLRMARDMQVLVEK